MFMDIVVVPLLFLAIFALLVITLLFNPVEDFAAEMVEATVVNVLPLINVFEKGNDRLFVIEPEKSVIYNTHGALYYYFEGGVSGRLCPHNEYAVVRITAADIELINETGVYDIYCSPVGSRTIYSHFTSDSFRYQAILPKMTYTLLDVLNYLIETGFALVY
ncbi:ORF78 [Agrotis segetum granulovirus]|uniref:ORF78 n=1 Tax=Agrotis segetum granulosis virus TaxID=10464 RepID=Q6QXN9_GVAS|nr:pif-4 [Agrotis segetum granulovirus]AAS82660.1 ORF78 [Agrotis segetum granulovirus]AHN92131.1 hypothetical protein AsGV091 [Agrotis segetum granulovirus]AKN63367.1 pif-4 [Agrotis segetum granulovirus]